MNFKFILLTNIYNFTETQFSFHHTMWFFLCVVCGFKCHLGTLVYQWVSTSISRMAFYGRPIPCEGVRTRAESRVAHPPWTRKMTMDISCLGIGVPRKSEVLSCWVVVAVLQSCWIGVGIPRKPGVWKISPIFIFNLSSRRLMLD